MNHSVHSSGQCQKLFAAHHTHLMQYSGCTCPISGLNCTILFVNISHQCAHNATHNYARKSQKYYQHSLLCWQTPFCSYNLLSCLAQQSKMDTKHICTHAQTSMCDALTHTCVTPLRILILHNNACHKHACTGTHTHTHTRHILGLLYVLSSTHLWPPGV